MERVSVEELRRVAEALGLVYVTSPNPLRFGLYEKDGRCLWATSFEYDVSRELSRRVREMAEGIEQAEREFTDKRNTAYRILGWDQAAAICEWSFLPNLRALAARLSAAGEAEKPKTRTIVICSHCRLNLTDCDLSGCNSCPQCHDNATEEIDVVKKEAEKVCELEQGFNQALEWVIQTIRAYQRQADCVKDSTLRQLLKEHK